LGSGWAVPGTNPERQEVLIVGAGPAGLLAACELARYGVMPRVVERQVVPHRQARATVIQPAGLELLARAGVLASFLEASVHVRRTRFFGPGRMEIAVSDFAGICCPYEYQCCLPQWQTESILLAHLQRAPRTPPAMLPAPITAPSVQSMLPFKANTSIAMIGTGTATAFLTALA
jgi:2-polyprenyl-6-methoxyphenol hydroxylase-like FAD-dependent oxidoreductase